MTGDVTAEIHGYSQPGATPTPWEVGREQVAGSDTFWISTVRPDGRPHVTPLIAVWHDEAIWFTTGPQERKARNLSHNAACILTTGRSDLSGLDVVVEGVAEQVTHDADLQPVADAFAARQLPHPLTGVRRIQARGQRSRRLADGTERRPEVETRVRAQLRRGATLHRVRSVLRSGAHLKALR